jgi:transposase
MKNWLRVRNIPFCDTVLKVQLYEIIKAYKPKYKTFLVDEIMTANGHTVLRLPPYHPDLNHRESIWAKLWVGAKKKEHLEQMTLNIFASRDLKKLEKTGGLVFVNM